MTSDAASMGALQGYRIIDMTSMISGPLGTVVRRHGKLVRGRH
jgi:crotonobetainyl-CoA:carnitine CoA-transferase CaiB-like acyl-CoA transferase